MSYRIRRVDKNQSQIVQDLRDYGVSVAVTSSLGNGFADIVCGYQKMTFIFEIKDGSKPPSRRKLTKEEQDFKDSWLGQYDIIHSMDEAVAVINHYKRKYNVS